MQRFRRFEFKYPMSQLTAYALQKKLIRAGMEHDPFSNITKNNTYTVTSLYFDSPRLNDYSDKAGGFMKRKKIRARIYTPNLADTTKDIWLECKKKNNMLTSKARIKINISDYDKLISGSYSKLISNLRKTETEEIDKIFFPIVSQCMKPKIIVRYNRIPIISRHNSDIRITFDSDIEACAGTDLRYTPFMNQIAPQNTVMEVKFTFFLPHWFRSLIREFNLIRTDFSKYGKSVETIHRFHNIPR
ncbi:MAG: polyphosphate polymerase domain-containing protein [Patescibacteria group bacterium]